MRLCFLLFLTCAACSAATRIVDSPGSQDSRLRACDVSLTVLSDPATRKPPVTFIQVRNGQLEATLEPNRYLATWTCSDHASFSETWNVPAASQPLKLASVRASSGLSGVGSIVYANGTATAQDPLVCLDSINHRIGVGTCSPAQALDLALGNINFGRVDPPASAPTSVAGVSGDLTGTYSYAVTFVTAAGETDAGPSSAPTAISNQQMQIANIPVSVNPAVVARNLYRTSANGSRLSLLATLNDNTTTTFVDDLADTMLGIAAPIENTTSGRLVSGGNLLGFLGQSNSFLGQNAGFHNTSGTYNTFVGVNAGLENTTGYNNVFVGSAGVFNSTGYDNSVVGVGAAAYNTSGQLNTMMGADAGHWNTTGKQNTFLGSDAGYQNTTGIRNTATGFAAGQNATTGGMNTYDGAFAGALSTTGNGNTFTGFNAGYYSTGDLNAFHGYNAGLSNLTGTLTTAIGAWSAGGTSGNSSGSYNAFLGAYSGYANTSGFFNVFLGFDAGYTFNGENANTSGAENTFVGSYAGPGTSTPLWNATAIGFGAVVSSSNTMVLGNGAVDVLVGGTVDGGYRLDIANSSTAGTARFWDQTALSGDTVVVVESGAAGPARLAFVANSSSPDVALSRAAAGVLEVNTGTAGSFADFKARNLLSGGGLSTSVTHTNADYTVSATDSILLCDASLGNTTHILPTAAGISGREYTLKKADVSSNRCSFAALSTETIDGAATLDLTTPYSSHTVFSDGTAWYVK